MDDDAGTAPEATTDGGGDDGAGRRFRLAYVPGATPAKWVRTWRERLPDVPLELVAVEPCDAERALRDDEADAAILRLPVDRDVLSAIRLYEEAPVVLVSRDHLLAALEPEEPVALDDLADDVLLRPLDDVVPWAGEAGAADDAPQPPGRPADERPATTGDAVVLVAANVGVAVVPQSLARLHHRKDVTYRRLEGAPSAPVALAWVADRDDDLVEEMVGIVRGRTANSSRGRRATAPAEEAAPARERRDRDARGGAGRGGAGTGRGGAGTGRAGAGGGRGGGGAQGRGTPKGRGARGRGGKRR
ncbi:LysR family transcriptional regulator [Cellulosimicrobium terreum]|uniref:LysR family transcriptional regulator n=2 Tax=Cellulosimicrobium funkei TaxID=264251 RepID=A0A4Y8R135_9MICO|nr:LysR substrate-binding domain-containing protein [Cellulosimicrobium funkei]TFF08635.1 LysR family transcriptional regulator [Cellulosimicrobium funkei]TGA73027.1 LysR family transcriptional regulator [Cellulosimicrobium terreum]